MSKIVTGLSFLFLLLAGVTFIVSPDYSNGIIMLITLSGLLHIVLLIAEKKHNSESSSKESDGKTNNIQDDTAIVKQVEKLVDDGAEESTLSVLGMKYRYEEHVKFEEAIDGILSSFLKIIHSHLSPNTTAIFFPTNDNGFKLRKYISKTENINKKAIIYPGVGVIGSFIKEGLKQLKLDDIVTDSMTLFYYTRDAGISSLMASPIVAEGEKRGFVIVDSISRDKFTDEDHAFLSVVADAIGKAVFYAYMYNEYRLNYKRLFAISDTEYHFFNNRSIDGILDKMSEIISVAFNCDRMSISLLKDDKIGEVKRVLGHEAESFEGLTFHIEEKSLANVLYTKHLCFYRNLSDTHYEYRYSTEEKQCFGFKSFIAYPIGVKESKGMVLLESKNRDAYSENIKEFLGRLVSSAGIAIEKVQVLKQTEDLAIRDGLTGLYNHRQFQNMLKDTITRSLRYKVPVALTICDIDHFKSVNDTYGHRFGDVVLKTIAEKLDASVRDGVDHCARYGGEEFTMTFYDMDEDAAIETVNRIRESIAEMVFQTPQGKDIHVTMSFGIAIYGKHAKEQELLIRNADKALYRAKDTGRNKVEIYYRT